MAYEQQGKYVEAVEAHEKGIALGGALAFSTAFISHAYASSGQPEKTWDKLRELQEIAKT